MMKTYCMICDEKKEIKHLPLYVEGSEGLNVCHSCEMALVHYIRGLMVLASKSRMKGYKNAKEVAKAKSN